MEFAVEDIGRIKVYDRRVVLVQARGDKDDSCLGGFRTPYLGMGLLSGVCIPPNPIGFVLDMADGERFVFPEMEDVELLRMVGSNRRVFYEGVNVRSLENWYADFHRRGKKLRELEGLGVDSGEWRARWDVSLELQRLHGIDMENGGACSMLGFVHGAAVDGERWGRSEVKHS